MKAYLCLGSNLGDSRKAMADAARMIAALPQSRVISSSRTARSRAWGKTEQADFLNQVLVLDTGLQPRELLDRLLGIEQGLGRIREEKWGPRLIDIDILMMDDLVLDEPGLKLPHPHMHERGFVLCLMRELEPELLHPVLKKTIEELWDELDPEQKIDG